MPGPFKRGLIIDELKWLQKTLEFPKPKTPRFARHFFLFSRSDWINFVDPEWDWYSKKNKSHYVRFLFLQASYKSKVLTALAETKTSRFARHFFLFGRGDWIRTSDLQHPMLIRYRTALHPEKLFGAAKVMIYSYRGNVLLNWDVCGCLSAPNELYFR